MACKSKLSVSCTRLETSAANDFSAAKEWAAAQSESLEDFVLDYEKIQGDKLEYFMKIGNEIFDEYFVDEISKELWRPRLKNIAKCNLFIEKN